MFAEPTGRSSGADDDRGPGRAHQASFADAQVDRDRTLRALRGLETALARPAGGEAWIADLESSLDGLRDAMTEERRELDRPDSLLMMISAEHPRRYGPRVRGIEEQYADIARQLESFRRELEATKGSASDIGDLRHRAGWIIRALHDCRNRQADLVFDALGLDLGDQNGQ